MPRIVQPHRRKSAVIATRKVGTLLHFPSATLTKCSLIGHVALDCKNARKIDRSNVPDVPAEVAWAELKAASDERDLDDIKEAAQKYIKATPDATYPQLENAFRAQNMNIHLIGIEKELALTYTNMDLQGNLDKKYTVSWRLSPNHQRPKEKDFWPASTEENLARLHDAGEPVDRGIPKCGNCENLGHVRKNCPEEKQENADRAEVKCFNCDAIGWTDLYNFDSKLTVLQATEFAIVTSVLLNY